MRVLETIEAIEGVIRIDLTQISGMLMEIQALLVEVGIVLRNHLAWTLIRRKTTTGPRKRVRVTRGHPIVQTHLDH